jgi:hypothetical protein
MGLPKNDMKKLLIIVSTAENSKAFLDGVPQNVVNAMHLAPG